MKNINNVDIFQEKLIKYFKTMNNKKIGYFNNYNIITDISNTLKDFIMINTIFAHHIHGNINIKDILLDITIKLDYISLTHSYEMTSNSASIRIYINNIKKEILLFINPPRTSRKDLINSFNILAIIIKKSLETVYKKYQLFDIKPENLTKFYENIFNIPNKHACCFCKYFNKNNYDWCVKKRKQDMINLMINNKPCPVFDPFPSIRIENNKITKYIKTYPTRAIIPINPKKYTNPDILNKIIYFLKSITIPGSLNKAHQHLYDIVKIYKKENEFYIIPKTINQKNIVQINIIIQYIKENYLK